MTTRAQASAAALTALQRPIRDYPGLIHLAPPATHPGAPLKDIVVALSRNPAARTVFVTDAEDHLLGAISEHALDLDLMTLVLPEPIWSQIREWDTRELLRAAKGKERTARDLMTRVDALKPERPLREALAIMSHHKDSIAPLVDEQGRLLGYITLFETLAELLTSHP